MVAVKLTTVGNSVGIVLPKEVLARLHAQKGDKLYLVEAPDGYHMTAYSDEVAEQLKLAEEVMREDREVLRALAK